MSQAKYTGHVGDGGLQGHSVGALYPYVVYGQETEAGLKYGVMNGTKSEDTGPLFFHCKSAYRVAEILKRGNVTIEDVMKAEKAATSFLRHSIPLRAMACLRP